MRASLADRGFTLIELMITVAILAIPATIAVPSFNDAILGDKLISYSNSFVAAAQVARSEAIKRNATFVVCRSADGTGCAASDTWQQGWLVLSDDGAGAHKATGSLTLTEPRSCISRHSRPIAISPATRTPSTSARRPVRFGRRMAANVWNAGE